jgi:hypothetical protein
VGLSVSRKKTDSGVEGDRLLTLVGSSRSHVDVQQVTRVTCHTSNQLTVFLR